MKITRTINGKTVEIELTTEEINAAYKEHARTIAKNKVRGNMEFCLSEAEYIQLKGNQNFIETVADRLVKAKENFGVLYSSIRDAIAYYKEDYLQ